MIKISSGNAAALHALYFEKRAQDDNAIGQRPRNVLDDAMVVNAYGLTWRFIKGTDGNIYRIPPGVTYMPSLPGPDNPVTAKWKVNNDPGKPQTLSSQSQPLTNNETQIMTNPQIPQRQLTLPEPYMPSQFDRLNTQIHQLPASYPQLSFNIPNIQPNNRQYTLMQQLMPRQFGNSNQYTVNPRIRNLAMQGQKPYGNTSYTLGAKPSLNYNINDSPSANTPSTPSQGQPASPATQQQSKPSADAGKGQTPAYTMGNFASDERKRVLRNGLNWRDSNTSAFDKAINPSKQNSQPVQQSARPKPQPNPNVAGMNNAMRSQLPVMHGESTGQLTLGAKPDFKYNIPDLPPLTVTQPSVPISNAEHIKAIQRAAGIKEDGIYGPQTRAAARNSTDPRVRAAVMAMQRANGLADDGIIGRNTYNALNRSGNAVSVRRRRR